MLAVTEIVKRTAGTTKRTKIRHCIAQIDTQKLYRISGLCISTFSIHRFTLYIVLYFRFFVASAHCIKKTRFNGLKLELKSTRLTANTKMVHHNIALSLYVVLDYTNADETARCVIFKTKLQ